MTHNSGTVITNTNWRIKKPKISTVIYYRILQNNQIILLLLIGTVMEIIYCYKICVFCFENKHIGPALYCCDGGAFIFETLVFFNLSFGKIGDRQ